MALIDKASLLFVPSVVAQEKAFNILPSGNRAPDSTGENSGYDQTRADFDFDRGSNTAATRVNADGLIEKYRENLLTQSNNFSDSDWTKYGGVTLTSGQADKDGGTDAWLLTKPAAGFTGIGEAETITGVITFSVFAKANTHSKVTIRLIGTPDVNVVFNLSDGTIFGGTSLGWIDRKIESVENGWYKCSLTLNNSGATNAVIYPDEITNTTTGSILIQSAQLEASMVATDYLDSTSVTGKAGVLIDLPRIDYTSGAGALLLEPQRQQLFQYSEWFGGWTTSGSPAPTLTANYAESPEGVDNAYRVEIPSVSGVSFFAQLVSHTSGTNMTVSAYVKSNTATDQSFKLFGDYGTGTGTSGALTATSEWQRFKFTFTPTATGNRNAGIINVANTAADLLVYGMQIETASYATSYIPNHGESGGVTRSFDLMETTSEEDIFTSGEGVVFIEFDISDATITGYPEVIRIENPSDATDKFWFYIYEDSDANEIRFGYRLDDTNVKKVEGSITISTTTTAKLAMRLENNNYALYYNGTKQTPTQYAGVVSDLRKITSRGREYFNGLGIKQFAVFNEALSDSELETLTTL